MDLTVGGSDGKSVPTGHFSHRVPPEGSHQHLDPLVLPEVLHAQLAVLVAAKRNQTAPFCPCATHEC